MNTSTISGSNLYFTGSIIDGKKTFTDENGEEIEYDNYRSALKVFLPSMIEPVK